jgi:hypothetical protein
VCLMVLLVLLSKFLQDVNGMTMREMSKWIGSKLHLTCVEV